MTTPLPSSILLLALLELVAIVARRVYLRLGFTAVKELPYYLEQEWSGTYRREAMAAERMCYAPHLSWKHQPFEGETFNSHEEAFRPTPNAECGNSSYRVLVFAGSTLLGWGSPDWGTIPRRRIGDDYEPLTRSFCETVWGATSERPYLWAVSGLRHDWTYHTGG